MMEKDWRTDWRIGFIALVVSALMVLANQLGAF
jgi:hypothetical protein